MPNISWGKPDVFFGAQGSTFGADTFDFEKAATPAEDSTQLTGQQGEKVEAKIEGGAAEDTKYKDPTLELVMKIRMAKEDSGSLRRLPTALYKSGSTTEYTKDKVAVCVIPENPAAPGFFCAACSVSIIETYTASEGAFWEITLSINVPTSGKAIQWGQYYATEGTGDDAGKFKITAGVQAA